MFDQWLEAHQEAICKATIAWRRKQNDTTSDEFIRTGAEIALKLLGQALRGEVNWEEASRAGAEHGLVRGITVKTLAESSYGMYRAISQVLRDERPEHWVEWLDTLSDYMLIAAQVVTQVLEVTLEEQVRQRTQEVTLFKTMADNSTEAILIVDPETSGIIYANRAAYEMYGYDYDRREMEETAHRLKVWCEEDLPFVTETIYPQVLAGGWRGEIRQKRKDGVIFEASVVIFPLHDDSGKLVAITGMVRDITERKQAEKELAETKALLEAVVDQSPVPITVIGVPDMVLRMENPAALKHLGIEDEASKVGRSLFEIKPTWQIFDTNGNPVAHTESPLAKAAQGIELHGVEYMIKHKDGTIRWNMMESVPIYNKEGRHIAGMIIFPDITERKRAEEEKDRLQAQLLQAQKMESVGRLAGGVAHDFNNMLGVIIGRTELVMRQVNPAQPVYPDLQEIHKAAQRSAELTRQLLAFARKQIISPKVLDLNDTIAGTLKMLQRLIGEDIDLIWKPGARLWPVKVDPTQVDQVLANLAVNARDAIAGVGSLIIETENVLFDETYAGFAPGEYVLLAVSDTGAGMDQAVLEHLFEPFFTTKEVGQGTGLGLATVYGIIEQNNGFINVYSEPGQGTTFKLYLPRVREAAAAEQGRVEQAPARGTETVLLVEDERTILELGQAVLRQYGYTVLAAPTPAQALVLAGQHEGPIHLLVTDVVMPGMNGQELRNRLLALRPGLKVLYMSGYTANVIVHHGVLDEGVHFLPKPFSIHTLVTRVREALDQ